MELAAFSGQGIPSGQLAELRRVAKSADVLRFLGVLSSHLADILSSLPAELCTTHFAHGLNIAAWAKSSAAASPDLQYFNSSSVTLVLTFAVQVACFKYVWVKSGRYPAAGAVGHSQGLAAAMVAALASCERTFEDHACTFARVLLHAGLAIAEHVPPAESYALAIVKVPVEVVAKRILARGWPSGLHLAVTNGACACTITGTQTALAAFEEEAIDELDGALCRRLPVRAPYHCAELLGKASAACLERLADGTPIHPSRLVRPCWSCVNGANLRADISQPSQTKEPPGQCSHRECDSQHSSCQHGDSQYSSSSSSLQTYLVRALLLWPVHWPAAVCAAARHAAGTDDGGGACLLVDFGPGGGSGVARMTNVICEESVAGEEAAAGEEAGSEEAGSEAALRNCRTALRSCRAEYFTQRHLVPGQLPRSWLAWIKSAEGEAGAALGESEVKATPVVKASKPGFVFFSERLKQASGGGESLNFSAALLEAIDLELVKMRRGRQEAIDEQASTTERFRAQLQGEAMAVLRRETTMSFDTALFPLREAFAALIGLSPSLPLQRLHERFNGDRGSKRDRREKAALLAPLTQADARQQFLRHYEELILTVLAPHVHAACGCDGCRRVVFQSFPCVRVHRPGEFSIG